MMQRYLLFLAFFTFIMLIFLKLWQIIGDKISGEYFSISFFGRIFLPIITRRRRSTAPPSGSR